MLRQVGLAARWYSGPAGKGFAPLAIDISCLLPVKNWLVVEPAL